MVTRVICYHKNAQGLICFAISPRKTFQSFPGLPMCLKPEEVGLKGVRLESFDWAVGDRGRMCTLWELSLDPAEGPLRVPWGQSGAMEDWQWCTFGALSRGGVLGHEDRRFLLLAVQFISAGGVPEDAAAAPTDDHLLQALRANLMGK